MSFSETVFGTKAQPRGAAYAEAAPSSKVGAHVPRKWIDLRPVAVAAPPPAARSRRICSSSASVIVSPSLPSSLPSPPPPPRANPNSGDVTASLERGPDGGPAPFAGHATLSSPKFTVRRDRAEAGAGAAPTVGGGAVGSEAVGLEKAGGEAGAAEDAADAPADAAE
jgi:hypothetical protein